MLLHGRAANFLNTPRTEDANTSVPHPDVFHGRLEMAMIDEQQLETQSFVVSQWMFIVY